MLEQIIIIIIIIYVKLVNYTYLHRLSLENFTENPEEKNDVYDLYAVINHIGELYRGHCEYTRYNMEKKTSL